MNHPKEIKVFTELFKVLGNEKRLCILINLCLHGEQTVGDLAKCANGAQSYVSQQLGKLRDQKIVASRKEGLQIYYKIIDENVKDIITKTGLNNICKIIN
ncbi:MAG: metalloregulator ArsR/SmtB family transcription factor [Clostridia bacterium]